MGMLAKALSAQSSYAAKKTDLWPELLAMIENCVLPDDVDDFERHLRVIGLRVPDSWTETLDELIEKKRDEIAQNDISRIVRDNFDF